MPLLAALIFASLCFYIYFKIKYVRTPLTIEKKYVSAKANMALGSFIFLFGLNELFLYHTGITYVIASVFMALGLFNVSGGYKRLRFYGPYMEKEKNGIRSAQ
ncbi:putative membrane protein YtpI [Weizmannia acidilactici]|uniref:Membrane protein YtpI n=1 Tax=Weizmannia acidilactici TaxID=2607726 RepID=A0A5J4JI00_9BACI|nr:YtpI family protein [Weizmannia acidilactici]GER67003.1 putative membrane protein YtpI [Weizmannia acidilactici]GER70160.1 putative membrane protein YtpI [Weizmannia acidilactici]GER73280.1 putative membrane protein YtpI [Weizmannia acidilactici]